MNIKKWVNGICLSIIMIAGLFMVETSAQAGTVHDSPYVTKSPDGKAFTFNHKDTNWKWYDKGTEVITGILPLRDPEEGEHKYQYERKGSIPIKKWVVEHKTGTCCHNGYPYEGKSYHGIDYGRQHCLGRYYSGWNSYCADCEEPISGLLMYMSEEAAQSITELDIDLEHYYTCPHCNNLEQGSSLGTHNCKGISWNKYKVEYNANTSNSDGYMDLSTHMYNNATEYEGKPITPATRLTKNAYTRTGYEFMGWDTIPDGTDIPTYVDNQEIFNLTSDNLDNTGKGVITLYAQWKKSESTLHINPNGGTYQGNHENTSKKQEYRSTYVADPKDIVPPNGFEVSFVTGYSTETPSIVQTRTFQEWQVSDNLHGKFEGYTYTYFGKEGMEDTITATYSYDSVTLPTPVGLEDGSSSFGGWFYDKECTSPAGKAGDKITPNSNLTLYAKRVELLLKAVNNMNPYGGSGAVNLSWNQNDGFEKTYLLYQSTDNKGWKRIYGASDLAETKNVNQCFNWNGNGKKEDTYIIPYTGFYTLTAFGAQGGNYGANRGGCGGQAEGKIWLAKGEKVTYTLGGQNGYNGGGSGNMFSNGGGCTIITTDKKGTILIAGGGGGATSLGNGYNGGSTARNLSTGYNGENGEAGGGGGYKGGKAGEHIVHNHTEDCYFTTSLDYTLLNNATQYISPWMQNFYDNSPWIRSGGHTKTNTIWRVRAHTVSNKENAQYYLGVYDNGTKKTYAPTNGNKEVYISAYMECTGGNDPFTETTFLEVYNQDDELLYRKNADEIPQYYNEAQALEASICNYGNNSGKVYFYKNYTDTNYFYWNETIPLSSKDTGIRVSLQLEVNGHKYPGCWYHISLNEISFRGGIQKHPKCGYTDNQVISSAPAFGGSNYANPKYFTSQTSYIGTKANNGSFAITSNQIGFEDLLYLNEVKATDLAPPTQVVLPKDAKTDIGNNQVKVVWNESRDNGTVYYHKAESYQKPTSTKLSTSNTTRNELISGIKGYYYLVDNSGGTTVSTANGTFTSHPFATVTVTNDAQYLHICAVDVAGNISPTTHIPIGLEDSEIAWNIFTDKIQISSLKDSIYLSNRTDTYYVKADSKTPFSLEFNGYIKNNATKSYQVNYLVFDTSIEKSNNSFNTQYCLQVPCASIIQNTLIQIPYSDIHKKWSDTPLFLDDNYLTIKRSNYCKNLEILHRFTMPSSLHGKTIKVTPRAGAEWQSEVIYSDYERDLLNSIYLIGDSIPPVISGIEEFGDLNQTVWSAKDADSGLREFYVIVTNQDNRGTRTFTATEDGLLNIDIDEEDTLFIGDFSMEFHAVDKVGNETIEYCGGRNLSVTAYIERILEPHTPIFRGGESGNLHIATKGYVDKVEIIFPEEFEMLSDKFNQVIEYPIPALYKEEIYKFMIPLYFPEGAFQVKIKAYKNEEVKECDVTFTTLGEEENVLNDIRTRLR